MKKNFLVHEVHGSWNNKKLLSGEIVSLIVHAFYFQALYGSVRDYFYCSKNFTAIPLRVSQCLFNIYWANTCWKKKDDVLMKILQTKLFVNNFA